LATGRRCFSCRLEPPRRYHLYRWHGIDPARYGGNTAHPELGDIDPERDEAELIGIKAVVERRNMPILCVCRGMQLLNVALGGSLGEHVPDLVRGDNHRDGAGLWAVHSAEVIAGTKTTAVLDTSISNGTSRHHQALRIVAPSLAVTARAPDDVIEAVQHAEHHWCFAIQ
jgi:putative glutamine amidotransferase